MPGDRWVVARVCAVMMLLGGVWVSAQQAPVLPYDPPRAFGGSITGSFEGWFDNPDGSHSLLVGYLNRNLKQPQDVPIGLNNRIEPGGPDLGQPTHFLPARGTGVFVVKVPKEFTKDQRLTWTLVVNGQTTTIPLRLHTDYVVSPFTDVAVGNTPPVVRLTQGGPTIQGPVATLATATTLTTSVSVPLTLSAWVDDDGRYSSGSNAPVRDGRSPVAFRWSKYRGPDTVTFDRASPTLEVSRGGGVNEPFSASGTTTARFGAPGDYALHLLVTDFSGEGGNGEICCWTNAFVKVTVTR